MQEVIPYKINQYPIVCNPYAQPKNDFKKRQIKKKIQIILKCIKRLTFVKSAVRKAKTKATAALSGRKSKALRLTIILKVFLMTAVVDSLSSIGFMLSKKNKTHNMPNTDKIK